MTPPRKRRPTTLDELKELRARVAALEERNKTLEAICERVVETFATEWTDGDQQAALRACRAAFEHRPIHPLPPLKEWKKTAR